MANDFAGQQPGEEVQFIFRRHRSVMTRDVVMAAGLWLLTFAPLVLTRLGYLSGMWAWYPPLIGLMLAGLMIFHAWLQWYYTIYIVTNLRIRQQVQRGLFRKTALDIDLAKVQNIRYNISGLRGSLCGYGTIVLQTMAGDLVMNRIDHCEDIYGQLAAAVRQAGGHTNDIDNDYNNEAE